jgi:hypothetical protein
VQRSILTPQPVSKRLHLLDSHAACYFDQAI